MPMALSILLGDTAAIPAAGILLFPFVALASRFGVERVGTEDADFISEGLFCDLSSVIKFTRKFAGIFT
jgi:hypothetical protein